MRIDEDCEFMVLTGVVMVAVFLSIVAQACIEMWVM